MRQCLRCGEKIYGKTQHHPPCAKKVFGVKYSPTIDIDFDAIPEYPAPDDAPFSVSDVQKEIPLTFNKHFRDMEQGGRIPQFFLKPPVNQINQLPEIQNLCMLIARRIGVAVPLHSLIKFKETDINALIIKPFVRTKEGKLVYKTFGTLLEKENKYDGTVEEIGEKIRRISDIPGLDVQLFFEMVMLSFILGNYDIHLDTFGILYGKSRRARMAPLRDVAAVQLRKTDDRDFYLPMLGKTEGITGSDFQELAHHLKIPQKAYDKMFLRFFDGKRSIGRLIKHSVLEMDDKIKLDDIVTERFRRLMR